MSEASLTGLLFLRGLAIGFAIAAPVGPIGVLCIRRTLAHGRTLGFVSGLGAATADALYGALAALGLAAIVNVLVGLQSWLQLVGGLFLCYLGAKTLLTRPGSMDNTSASSLAEAGISSKLNDLLGSFASTFFLTLTNPVTILAFVAIFAGLGVAASGGFMAALVLVGGVFLGSALWWFLLSGTANLLRVKFLNPGSLRWINWGAGAILLGFGLIAILAGSLSTGAGGPPQVQPLINQEDERQPPSAEGYARATGPAPLSFPADHGPHPDFQTEWWYYTGNLATEDGRRFGYQVTFFRRALQPPADRVERASTWATEQLYLAHFALTDVAGGNFYAFERLARGAVELAGAQSPPYRVWLEDWQVEQVGKDNYHLRAGQEGIEIDLLMVDAKGPVLQGEKGYSPKGPEVGNASYYISQTRLETSGTVRVGDVGFQVVGLSWMDHEFSTSALSAGQVGWDWFALQLDDGSELMVFDIRREDGSLDPFSSGTLIRPDGSTTHLNRIDFEIQVLDTWKSPHSGAVYPARWRVAVPSAGITLDIEPHLADQELNLTYNYWEGAVRIQGERGGKAVTGNGYVELTGYAGSMAGEF